MNTIIRIFPVICLLAASVSRADVSLDASHSVITVAPGGSFSLTLNLNVSGSDQVAGVNYFWSIDAAFSGMAFISGRDYTGSLFDDVYFSNATILASPANALAPRNGRDLGATPDNWEDYAGTGAHFLATYTFSVDASVTGSFVLNTVSIPTSGWADTNFDSHDFTSHASVIINVAPIPEPAGTALLVAAASLIMAGFVARRRSSKNAPGVSSRLP